MNNDLDKIKKKNSLYIYVICAIAFALLVIIGYIGIEKQDDKSFIFITLIGIIVISVITVFLVSVNKHKINIIYKENFVLPILKGVFQDVNYNQEYESSSIKKIKEILKSGVFYLNEYLNAKYNGISFELADIRLTENMINHNTNRLNYDDIFKGQWLIFNLNNEIKSEIRIYNWTYDGVRKFSVFSKKYYKIKSNDDEFDSHFVIYATSKEEANSYLTKNVLDKLMRLYNVVDGKLLFCFVDNKLYVGINNYKDLFEHKLNENINDEEIKIKIYDEIKSITDCINILKYEDSLLRK